jgi:uncharacterized protein YciI
VRLPRDSCTLVLLRRAEGAPELPEEELDAIQERHLAHLRSMRERGAMAVAGPFGDQPDERLRGMCLYTVGLEEARELAHQDPAVQAGRLAVDVLTWYFPRGEVTFAWTTRTPT